MSIHIYNCAETNVEKYIANAISQKNDIIGHILCCYCPWCSTIIIILYNKVWWIKLIN